MRFFIAILAILAALVVGVKIGANPDVPLVGDARAWLVGDSRERQGDVVPRSKKLKLDDLRKLIERDFYRSVPQAKLEDASATAMAKSLNDPYTQYFSPSDNAKFKQLLSGSYSGVGMAVDSDKRGLVVLKVYPGTPAEEAKIRSGDVVSAVDGKNTKGVPADAVVARIKGREGTTVVLKVRRPLTRRAKRLGPPRTLTLTRRAVDLPLSASKIETVNGKQIGRIELAEFSSNATQLVAKEIVKLQAGCARAAAKSQPTGAPKARKKSKACAQAYVLDLRGNGGGYLESAVGISSLFLKDGVVVATDGRARKREVFDATGSPLVPDAPLVILVDRGSASASEIVAGAMKYRNRATLVGTRTFGKGVFQESTTLNNGGALKITLGQYFVAGNVPITKKGINPDVQAQDNPKTPTVDEGMQAALKTVSRQLQRGR
ncbi:MAG: S41 family peptidase [Thermoleophilaceae bacterium]|nr:S41 family peptidase [Thermoleophilaceae bacterium]